jgi:hypothetical protein
MVLILKPTDLGSGNFKDDYEVLAKDRRSIGRSSFTHKHRPVSRGSRRLPPVFRNTHSGYAESREQAMADFKMAWQRKSVVVRREFER